VATAESELSIMNYVLRVKQWILDHKTETLFLGAILLLGAFLRLYKIGDYMTFLGDEGRDAIVVRRLLVDFDLILIGPGTSIGNMYLGPLYYYLMAPALLLSNFSPVGPAVMIALLGVVTIWFVWFVTREFFPLTFKGTTPQGKHNIHYGALAAALLYAISPVVITYSKSSWNPNIMPFFSLLCIYSIWKIWRLSFSDTVHGSKTKEYIWLVILGISYAFVLQSHYLGLLLLPTIILFWSLVLFRYSIFDIRYSKDSKTKKADRIQFIRYSIIGGLVFLFLMSPLVIFDARHDWRNFGAIAKFFGERETTVSIKPWKSIPNLFPIWKNDFVSRIFAGKNMTAGLWAAFGLFDLVVLYFVKYFKNLMKVLKRSNSGSDPIDNFISSIFILSVWIGVAIVGLGLYKQHIYDHYFGFIFAAPFILFGGLLMNLWKKYGLWMKALLALAFIFLIRVNLAENPLKYPPNNQMQRAQIVAEKIKAENGGEKFNLAVIAKQNYEDGYQYFLEKDRQPVYDIDPLQLSETVAGQLFVVCELSKDECDPTHSPKAEIANFGWSKIGQEWDISGVAVYKLVPADM